MKGRGRSAGLLRGARGLAGVVAAALGLAARRLWANGRLAAGLLAGFTVAVMAAASVPAFAATALQRVLQAELAAGGSRPQPAAVHLAHLEKPQRPTRAAQYAAADQVARDAGRRLLGLPVAPFVRYGALDLTQAQPVDPNRVNAAVDRWLALAFLSDLERHAAVTDGRLPRPGLQAGAYEAMVEEAALDQQDFTVGAEFWVPLNRTDTAPRVKVRVVGSFRRTNPDDPYWFLGAPFAQALFLPEETFTGYILTAGKVAPAQFSWYYGLDSGAIRVTDAARLLGALYDLEARVAQVLPDTELFSGPMDLLTRFALRALALQRLLLLLAVPALAVVAYFVVVTTGMMLDRQRQEIAVLRSRGASPGQVTAMFLAEGLLLAGLALGAGYPLGALLARAMGATAGFLQFVDRPQRPLQLAAEFWLYGGAAAVLAVLAYVAPALPAAGQGIVSYKQESARQLRRPFWARWGLDLLCLGLAGYAWYTLAGRPAAQAGAPLMEPLHVLAPALWVFGAGLLLLRLIPLLARLAAALAERRAGAPLYLALAQLSRAPGSYTPVVLLLTLTVGMGLYSATAARTLEQNVADRIRYAGGADAVLEEVWDAVDSDGDPQTPETTLYAPPWHVHYDLPGVAHPARVRIQEVTASVGGRTGRQGTLMAIDPVDFSQVAWFRRDLAPAHLNTYLNLLGQDEEAALVSREFLVRHKLQPGDRITLAGDGGQEVSLAVYAAVDYWPALFPEQGDFFVANLDYVEQNLGLRPYQVWLRLREGAGLQPVIDALRAQSVQTVQAHDFRQQLIRARRDPQLNGLLGGLTSGFLLAAGITVLGFWLLAALGARARLLQFGVLRAMGLSVPQLVGAVVLEQVLAVGAGVAAGTGLGAAAARLFVPFLQQGAVRTPPFALVAVPADRLRLYLILLLMLAVGVAGLVAALSRLRIHEAVKLGEDS